MKDYTELTEDEKWDIIVDMTPGMDDEEREEFLMDWGE